MYACLTYTHKHTLVGLVGVIVLVVRDRTLNTRYTLERDV
jgi:hypothetical protein